MFWHRLAAHLGMTVAEAQSRMGAREFRRWLAYYNRDPWDGERGDLRAAMICCVVANALGGKKGGGQFEPKDFMPEYGPKRVVKKMSDRQMYNVMRVFSAAHNRAEAQRQKAAGNGGMTMRRPTPGGA